MMKNKKTLIIIIISAILILVLSYAQTQKKKPPIWEPTLYNTDTNPYGTYITYNLLDDVFDNKVHSTRQPVYTNLRKKLDGYIRYSNEREDDYDYEPGYSQPEVPMSFYDSIKDISDTTAYMFINLDFELDKVDIQYFLDFIAIGNNAFISAERISRNLLDSLGIKESSKYFTLDSTYTITDYKEKSYRLRNYKRNTKLHVYDCQHPVRVLAQNSLNDTVFVQVKYGKGNIYLHTMPLLFTNYNVLKPEKYDFAFRTLSYIPENNHILWDEYQKQGLVGEQSMFRVMLNSAPLRIALYLILIGLLLYMIFESKRTQRLIPVIKKPVNSSIEFANTLSNLFYRKQDYITMTKYRMNYLLDFVRKRYYLSTETIDDEFIDFLQAKSTMERSKLEDMFTAYENILRYPSIAADYYREFNNLLEEFYRKVKN